MHTKSSHKTQTALCLWKDVGHLKNRNVWQFVGDGVSSQFIVTNRCNVPFCVAELVHWLLCTLRPELYVDITYSTGEWTNSATHSGPLSSWLRWTAMNLRLQQCHQFLSSDVRCPFRSQVQFVYCGCFLRAFSWVCWRCLGIRRILYLSSLGRIILPMWQNYKKNRNKA